MVLVGQAVVKKKVLHFSKMQQLQLGRDKTRSQAEWKEALIQSQS